MDFMTLVKEASAGENVGDVMATWADIFDNYVSQTKDSNKSAYENLIDDLYVTIYGERLSEEMAEKWVKSMKPIGEHWTMDETKKVLPAYDEVDGYAIANLTYNDYYEIVKNNEALAIKMTTIWLDDEDAGPNKTYNYWRHVVERD